MQLLRYHYTWKARATLLTISIILMATAVSCILVIFNENITFFFTPSEILQHNFDTSKIVRLGGIVKENSIKAMPNGGTEFIITDLQSEVKVHYLGAVPGLFQEGSGTVAIGSIGEDNVFKAKELLAKHDENYMPKEVAESLKKSGHWRSTEHE